MAWRGFSLGSGPMDSGDGGGDSPLESLEPLEQGPRGSIPSLSPFLPAAGRMRNPEESLRLQTASSCRQDPETDRESSPRGGRRLASWEQRDRMAAGAPQRRRRDHGQLPGVETAAVEESPARGRQRKAAAEGLGWKSRRRTGKGEESPGHGRCRSCRMPPHPPHRRHLPPEACQGRSAAARRRRRGLFPARRLKMTSRRERRKQRRGDWWRRGPLRRASPGASCCRSRRLRRRRRRRRRAREREREV